MIKSNRVVYAETLGTFKRQLKKGDFVKIMEERSQECGVSVNPSQIKAWNDYHRLLPILKDLPDDIIVGFEYQVPVGGRIDFIIFGHDVNNKPNAVQIEVKQWSNENVNTVYSHYAFEVEVDGYANSKLVSHPSEQVSEYQNHLLNYIDAFSSDSIHLSGLVYCYNYKRNHSKTDLISADYKQLIDEYPIYCEEDSSKLNQFLSNLMCKGNGEDVFESVITSKWKPTKRLQDAVANMFDGKPEFSLVGEQLTAFNAILGAIKNTPKDQKVAVIVKGGPGTGKSVIAMRLVSALAKECEFAYYVTRSSSLRKGFKKILKKLDINNKGVNDFIKNTFDFKPNSYDENEVNAIIVDEAHRIEKSSNWYAQGKNQKGRDIYNNTFLSQIMSLLYTARVSVFFVDDLQCIKQTNIGTSIAIREAAENYSKRLEEEINDFTNNEGHEGGIANIKAKIIKRTREKDAAYSRGNTIFAEQKSNKIAELNSQLHDAYTQLELIQRQTTIDKIPVFEIELPDQFRCNGSDNYLDWLNDVINNGCRKKHRLDPSQYEFDVFDTPQALYEKVKSLDDYAKIVRDLKFNSAKELRQYICKVLKFKPKQTARLAAGWCWDWKNELAPNGDLLKEVVIEGSDWNGVPFTKFEMPWETKAKPRGDFKYHYADNAELWANQPEGINQVGCIFSMQGWELDYVGIIIGPDLVYDKENDCLVANKDGGTHDVDLDDVNFDSYVKNIYRVLLTRGKKGCFIFCCDPEVGKYFKRCMNL